MDFLNQAPDFVKTTAELIQEAFNDLIAIAEQNPEVKHQANIAAFNEKCDAEEKRLRHEYQTTLGADLVAYEQKRDAFIRETKAQRKEIEAQHTATMGEKRVAFEKQFTGNFERFLDAIHSSPKGQAVAHRWVTRIGYVFPKLGRTTHNSSRCQDDYQQSQQRQAESSTEPPNSNTQVQTNLTNASVQQQQEPTVHLIQGNNVVPDACAAPDQASTSETAISSEGGSLTKRHIHFDEVYGQGNAKKKYTIVSWPPCKASDIPQRCRYYILECEVHEEVFNSPCPPQAACRHVDRYRDSAHADFASAKGGPKRRENAIREFGTEVLDCDEEKMRMNNADTLQALMLERQETRSNKNLCRKSSGHGSENNAAVPIEGQIYTAFKESRQFAAVVLPLGAFDQIGLPGHIRDLLKQGGACYKYNERSGEVILREEYQRGGRQAKNRRIPIMYFNSDTLAKCGYGWKRKKELHRAMVEREQYPFSDTIREFERLRNAASRLPERRAPDAQSINRTSDGSVEGPVYESMGEPTNNSVVEPNGGLRNDAAAGDAMDQGLGDANPSFTDIKRDPDAPLHERGSDNDPIWIPSDDEVNHNPETDVHRSDDAISHQQSWSVSMGTHEEEIRVQASTDPALPTTENSTSVTEDTRAPEHSNFQAAEVIERPGQPATNELDVSMEDPPLIQSDLTQSDVAGDRAASMGTGFYDYQTIRGREYTVQQTPPQPYVAPMATMTVSEYEYRETPFFAEASRDTDPTTRNGAGNSTLRPLAPQAQHPRTPNHGHGTIPSPYSSNRFQIPHSNMQGRPAR